MKNTAKKLIVSALALAVVTVLKPVDKAYADCEQNYGGGETCVFNKSFRIEKEVRKAGDKEWKDKVTDVKKGDELEFRIKVKNVGEVSVDDMEMKDKLPDELEKLIGSAGLTEEWDDFAEGNTKEFIIRVKVNDEEFDRNDNFEKCVVNKASLYFKDKFEGADTATVCYGNGELTELPKTGADSIAILSVYGTALLGLGLI